MIEVAEKKFKVSVCVITYNQERYIGQCLQSIVNQETNFNYEVIVGDDCSTDGTRMIIQDFADNFPGLVRPIFHEKNVGGTKNLLSVYGAACGEYIAHMDGDDYMLPGKLKTQVDEMDNNVDCTMCFHKVKRFDESNKRFLDFVPKALPRKSDITFLLMNSSYFTHSSKMYRAECRNGLTMVKGEMLDHYFHVHHALRGKTLYLDKPLGVYRVNVGVATDSKDRRDTIYRNPSPKLIELSIEAIEYAGRSGVEPAVIKQAIAKAYFNFSYSCLLAKNLKDFKIYIDKSKNADRLDNYQLLFCILSNIPNLLFLIVRLRSVIRTRVSWFATKLGIFRLYNK